jgi:hypothetical protein
VANQEAWPDAADMYKARRAEQLKQTPIPEQIWALKNSAQTLAMTGVEGKAREMLEQVSREC